MATTTTTQQPLPQFAPYQNDYWARAQEVANTPYQQGPGTYVGPNQTMQDGWGAIQNRAMYGNPAMNAAQQGLQGFYGQQQMGATFNPYGPVQGGSNPYAMQDNPYLQSQIDAAQGDVVRNWNNVAKPAWDSQMAGSGSFGNANVAQAAGNSASDMQKNLGRISSDMRMGAYNQAANLTESGLNRNMSAQQFNAGMGEQFAGRNDSMYGNNQNRMLNAYSMAPQFANQDYTDFNALMGVAGQQQQFNQAQQNQNQNWWDQSRNYATNQLNTYGQQLGMMQPPMQSSQYAPDPSTMSQVIGGAITGAGLMNWWDQP